MRHPKGVAFVGDTLTYAEVGVSEYLNWESRGLGGILKYRNPNPNRTVMALLTPIHAGTDPRISSSTRSDKGIALWWSCKTSSRLLKKMKRRRRHGGAGMEGGTQVTGGETTADGDRIDSSCLLSTRRC